MDRAGYLYVTGRMKELIVSAGGDNILPIPIEQKLLVLCAVLCCVTMTRASFITASCVRLLQVTIFILSLSLTHLCMY